MSLLFKYPYHEGDKQYRLVSLMRDVASEWKELPQGTVVEYPEECVVEVEHIDGSSKIHYERDMRIVSVGRSGNMLYLDKVIPRARLWIRDNNGMEYKVPSELKVEDENAYMLIPDGTLNVVLFGDKYFSKAYFLKMG